MNRKLLIILVILIIMFLTLGLVGCFINNQKNSSLSNSITSTNEYKFKYFTFTIPKTISYKTESGLIFLDNEKWNAKIDIMIDNSKSIIDHKEDIRDSLVSGDYNIDDGKIYNLDGIDSLIYEFSDKTGAIVYAYYNMKYVFEIEYNGDLENYQEITNIAKMLYNSKFDDNTKEKYKFLAIEFDD